MFDVDGTLVDTEPLHLASLRDTLTPFAVGITDAAYYERHFGLADREVLTRVLADANRADLHAEIPALLEAKKGHMLARLARGVRPFPGAVDLVRTTAAAVPIAFVSAGLRAEIEAALRAIGLEGLDAPIVAAEDVERAKPDPEGYRRALDALLGAHAHEYARQAVAIEDSPNGIRAALAAGLTVAAVAHTRPPTDLTHAHLVTATIATLDLPTLTRLPRES